MDRRWKFAIGTPVVVLGAFGLLVATAHTWAFAPIFVALVAVGLGVAGWQIGDAPK